MTDTPLTPPLPCRPRFVLPLTLPPPVAKFASIFRDMVELYVEEAFSKEGTHVRLSSPHFCCGEVVGLLLVGCGFFVGRLLVFCG